MTPEQGLARLEAIEDIRQLRARYFHACDSKQLEIVCECFPEGEVELRYGHIGELKNREQMLAVFSELACQDHIVEMHHGQNTRSSRGDIHATI